MRFQLHRHGLKFAAIRVILSMAAAIGWIVWLRLPDRKITDRKLLREAVEEWKRGGEPGVGPDSQIFEQQAAQGYYEDAAATATLFKRPDDQRWSVEELAKIRAENGDIQGAKAMIKRFAGSDLANRATEAIAVAQVGNGDLQGALETAAPLGYKDEVLSAVAGQQIVKGDFDGALQTAEQMKSNSADQVFYEVGDGLLERGEQKRVHELASHMTNPKLAALFTKLVRLTLQPPEPEGVIQAGPCDIAFVDASTRKFAEADILVEQNKCPYVSGVAGQQYAVDPVGAEWLLQKATDAKDRAMGLADFASSAANKGEISEALRFYHELEILADIGSGPNVAHDIARSWTIKEGPKAVLKWARSRPTMEERTWALIGMAEALGHARVKKTGPMSSTRE